MLWVSKALTAEIILVLIQKIELLFGCIAGIIMKFPCSFKDYLMIYAMACLCHWLALNDSLNVKVEKCFK